MFKELTLTQRLKLIWNFLKDKRDAIIITCSYCQSAHISFKDSSFEESAFQKIYRSKYVCKDCGATGSNFQSWTKGLKDK